MEPGDVVQIRAFDDVPDHLFRVDEVYEDFITGVALTGPLQGEYGEPELSMVIRVLDPAEVALGTSQSKRVIDNFHPFPVRQMHRDSTPTGSSRHSAFRFEANSELDLTRTNGCFGPFLNECTAGRKSKVSHQPRRQSCRGRSSNAAMLEPLEPQ